MPHGSLFRGRASPRPPASGPLLPALLIGLLFLASAAPSPLYQVYQARWHFSSADLTGVFAVYSATVMLALNVLGPVSDRIGRRRVVIAGLLIVLAALIVFAMARSVVWIFSARALQGFGVGTASAALTAALVDSRPDGARGQAATAATVSSSLGMALGVLAAGLFLEYLWDPTVSLFVLLAVLVALGLLACRRIPDVNSESDGGARGRDGRSPETFRLRVPKGVRARFALYSLGIVVAWAVGGLYLSLGPSIASAVSGASSYLAGALAVSVLGFVAAGVAAACRHWSERSQVAAGAPVLMIGLAMVVVSCEVRSELWFLAGSVVLAWGWGLFNIGAFRCLVDLSEPNRRAEMVAAIYLVSYVAFSVPIVLTGVATDHFGLRSTTVAFGIGAAFLTLVAALAILIMDRPSSRWTASFARAGTVPEVVSNVRGHSDSGENPR